jgi:replicative DNA helicase
MGKYRMVKAFYSGKKTVYEMKTRTGRTIKASANHPFLKLEGWTRLDALSPGDRIGLPSSVASDIYWDSIISITKLPVEDVYDATVEDVHNFVANDIVVHNSIEQDSDLVMFLLRREYYDPYDKPGTAELIVAKNRHGAIGNINFAFRKEIAQFANLSSVRSGGTPDNDEAFSAFSPKK